MSNFVKAEHFLNYLKDIETLKNLKNYTNIKNYDIVLTIRRGLMVKYIQCVQNDNKNVTPQQTICAIKNAGFDGVFLQWYNKNWDFAQEEQLKPCKELGLEIQFIYLGYKGINNIWLEGEDGEALVKNYLNDLDVCKSNNIDMVVMHLTSKSIAPEPSLIRVERLQRIVDYAEQLSIKVAFENTKIWGYLEYVFSHIKNSNV